MTSTFKRLLLACGVLFAALMAFATPASAQATRTWISGVGDDANPCSRTAPCKTLAGAISKTATGGEINCLDPTPTGTVTITKSITLDCSGTFGSALSSGTSGIIVNGAGVNVVVRGLSLQGAGSGIAGVRFLAGASLTLENVLIQNFKASQAVGVQMTTGSASKLFITNSTIVSNGLASPATGGGIEIAPTAGGSARVVIRNTRIINSANYGLQVNTAGTTDPAGIVVSLDDVEISGGAQGIIALTPTSTTTASVTISNSRIANNAGFGILTSGAGATARIGSSVITGNVTGVFAAGGSSIRSYGTNQLNGNTTDGTFTAPTLSPL